MKKAIIAICAVGFITTAMTAPASAFLPVMWVMEAKKDKNFKEVNPYAPQKVSKKKKKKM